MRGQGAFLDSSTTATTVVLLQGGISSSDCSAEATVEGRGETPGHDLPHFSLGWYPRLVLHRKKLQGGTNTPRK